MPSLIEQANRTPISFIVLIAYVALGFLTFPETDKAQELLDAGACNPMLIPDEPWRLITCAFFHGGPVHLILVGLAIFFLGPGLEEMLGMVRFALLYAVSAIGGSLAVCCVGSPAVSAVGGSGAVFGIAAAALAMNMRRGRHLLDFMNYQGPRQLVVILVANLVIGAVVEQISNTAHVGGMIAGFALAFCFYERGREQIDRVGRVIQAGWIALFASMMFYSLQPVARWDHLWDRAEDPAYARALLLRTDDLKRLPLKRGVRPQLLRELRAIAARDR